MKKQILSRVGALMLALVMAVSMTATAWAAEGGGDQAGTTGPSVSIKVVKNVEQDKDANGNLRPSGIIRHGNVATLDAVVEDADVTDPDAITYSWSVSNNTHNNQQVLTYDSNKTDGKTFDVTGNTNDQRASVVLTVTIAGDKYMDSFDLTVLPARVERLMLVSETTPISQENKLSVERPGATVKIRATAIPDNARPNPTWTISNASNPSVITRKGTSAQGNPMEFIAGKAGTATITATADGVSTSVDVEVGGLMITNVVEGVPTETESLKIKEGKTATLNFNRYGTSFKDPNLNVIWSSSNPNAVNILRDNEGNVILDEDGNITIEAISIGSAKITVSPVGGGSGEGECYIEVVENRAQDISADVSDMILNFSERIPLQLGSDAMTDTIIGAIEKNCLEVTDHALNYVSGLSVSTLQGTLYYNYNSEADTGSGVGGMERYYNNPRYGERGLSGITFVPKGDFTGTATVNYTGYAANGKAFTGRIYLKVSVIEDVAYTTTANTAVQFKGADFSNVCTLKNGRGLSRISFTQPAKGEGTVYYNYSGSSMIEAVSPSKSYYFNGAPNINSLSFVPSTGFTGTVKIPYNAVDAAGTKYTGTVTIVVTPANGETYINYSAVPGETVEFKLDDFTKACASALGAGSSLNYVMFTLPSYSDGVLSYSYKSGNNTYAGNVSAGDRFFNTSGSSTNKPISSVRFAPASGVNGSVLINFDGYAADGKHFKGIVRIHIGDNDGGVINYSSSNGAPVKFDVESFNELCQRSIKETLDYVIFTLPSSQRGTLFRNYNNSYSSGTELTEGTMCYQGKTPLISDITFVPNLSFDGTASIGFTAYGVNGGHFIGTVMIDVSAPSDRTVKYNVLQGHAVKFNADDFNRMCQVATGKDLNYVRFTVPSSMRGTLCYNYNEQTGNYSSKVNSGSNYNRTGGQLIDNVYYLSESNQTGVIQLSFDGCNTSGTTFSGLVEINVNAPVAKTITYAGSSLAFDMYPSDFTRACTELTGKRLDYIEFDSLPSSSEGTLYTGFSGPRDHGEAAKTGTKYYISGTPSIDGLAFLPKAGYDDIVTLNYTGVDVSGTSYTGTVQMAINNYASSGYTDMGNYGWAESSVNFLTTYGVVNGTGNNQFSPSQFMRRADYMVMVCRAFRLNTGSTSGFNDVPSDSYYAWAVSTAKDLGIAYGYGNDFRPESPLTREDAMVFLQRVLNVVGEGIGNGSESYLNRFTDGGSVSSYAKGAVAAMVQRGLVTGDGNNMLKPKQYMSRAEMASFLHRVLTM